MRHKRSAGLARHGTTPTVALPVLACHDKAALYAWTMVQNRLDFAGFDAVTPNAQPMTRRPRNSTLPSAGR
jgi:hypothetical protein